MELGLKVGLPRAALSGQWSLLMSGYLSNWNCFVNKIKNSVPHLRSSHFEHSTATHGWCLLDRTVQITEHHLSARCLDSAGLEDQRDIAERGSWAQPCRLSRLFQASQQRWEVPGWGDQNVPRQRDGMRRRRLSSEMHIKENNSKCLKGDLKLGA